MSFPNEIHGGWGDQFDFTSTKGPKLGAKLILPDGRCYRYCKVGATATVAGSLYESEAKTTNWFNENPTVVAAVGATSVTMDVATTPSADDFEDGYLIDETNGCTYSVKSNTAADPTVLTLNDPLIVDLALADVVSVMRSAYRDVIVKTAAEPAAPVVGVAPCIQTAVYYGWLQTRGMCGVLVEDTVVVGDPVVASVLNDAGACEAATDDLGQVIGSCLEIGANTEIGAIFLTID
jgi:hypothetical protein